MGMSVFHKSSLGNYTPPNPDPKRFRILRSKQVGEFAVFEVRYDGCTTFGGRKISVYRSSEETVYRARRLDPHFQDSLSAPIARFPGTDEGWRTALLLADTLSSCCSRAK